MADLTVKEFCREIESSSPSNYRVELRNRGITPSTGIVSGTVGIF